MRHSPRIWTVNTCWTRNTACLAYGATLARCARFACGFPLARVSSCCTVDRILCRTEALFSSWARNTSGGPCMAVRALSTCSTVWFTLFTEITSRTQLRLSTVKASVSCLTYDTTGLTSIGGVIPSFAFLWCWHAIIWALMDFWTGVTWCRPCSGIMTSWTWDWWLTIWTFRTSWTHATRCISSRTEIARCALYGFQSLIFTSVALWTDFAFCLCSLVVIVTSLARAWCFPLDWTIVSFWTCL